MDRRRTNLALRLHLAGHSDRGVARLLGVTPAVVRRAVREGARAVLVRDSRRTPRLTLACPDR